MKTLLLITTLILGLALGFIGGAYLAYNELAEDFEFERNSYWSEISELQRLMPRIVSGQQERKFIVGTTLRTIDFVQDPRPEDLNDFLDAKCLTLEIFSDGLEPEYARSESDRAYVERLITDAHTKIDQLVEEGICLTRQFRSQPSAAGTTQSVAPN